MLYKKIFFLLIVFINITLLEATSQTLVSDIDSLWSNDIPIKTSFDSLYIIMNVPDHIDSLQKCRVTFLLKKGEWFDTTMYYNLIYYFDKGLVYAEKNGRVSIAAIELYKSKFIVIHTDKIVLNRTTRVKDVVTAFHLSSKDVLKDKLKLLEYKSRLFYSIKLSMGFSPSDISLIFDDKKKLLFISILPVY